MRILNYLNLNQHPIQLSFQRDRTHEFNEVYHSHQGIEILYVHSGCGKVITGGKIIELRPGILLFFRPFHMHRIQIDFEKEPYVRTLFVFEPAALHKYLDPFPFLHSFFSELFMNPSFQTVHIEIPLDKFTHFIEESRPLSEINSTERLDSEAFFLVSFINLLRKYISKDSLSIKTKPVSTTTDSINNTLHWLEAHFAEEFDLNKLAADIHLSPNHLSYLFRKETGSCISDYLAVRRIQEACMLLRTTSLSTEEIGNKIGINNFSYFCKFFKSHVGITPFQFRKTL